MATCLLGFGDSWSAGSGLDFANGEQDFVRLAARQFDIPCFNTSIPGTGLPHLILQFKKFIGQHYHASVNYHAVFFLTAIERDLCYNDNGTVEEINPRNPKFADYYAKIYSNDLAIFRLNTILLSLHQLCQHYGIHDHYIFGWQTPDLWPEINRDNFWQQGRRSVLDLFLEDYPDAPRNIIHLKENMNHPWIMKPQFAGDSNGGHPNQLGHEKIAQALIEWVDPCL
jgi:hypothetical protein